MIFFFFFIFNSLWCIPLNSVCLFFTNFSIWMFLANFSHIVCVCVCVCWFYILGESKIRTCAYSVSDQRVKKRWCISDCWISWSRYDLRPSWCSSVHRLQGCRGDHTECPGNKSREATSGQCYSKPGNDL